MSWRFGTCRCSGPPAFRPNHSAGSALAHKCARSVCYLHHPKLVILSPDVSYNINILVMSCHPKCPFLRKRHSQVARVSAKQRWVLATRAANPVARPAQCKSLGKASTKPTTEHKEWIYTYLHQSNILTKNIQRAVNLGPTKASSIWPTIIGLTGTGIQLIRLSRAGPKRFQRTRRV